MKKVIILTCFFFLLLPIDASAREYSYELVEQNAEYLVNPYADKIEIKYRKYNGKLQYRRWNATSGCWVDSDWIDL